MLVLYIVLKIVHIGSKMFCWNSQIWVSILQWDIEYHIQDWVWPTGNGCASNLVSNYLIGPFVLVSSTWINFYWCNEKTLWVWKTNVQNVTDLHSSKADRWYLWPFLQVWSWQRRQSFHIFSLSACMVERIRLIINLLRSWWSMVYLRHNQQTQSMSTYRNLLPLNLPLNIHIHNLVPPKTLRNKIEGLRAGVLRFTYACILLEIDLG